MEAEKTEDNIKSCVDCHYSSNGKHGCNRLMENTLPKIDLSKGYECAYNGYVHYLKYKDPNEPESKPESEPENKLPEGVTRPFEDLINEIECEGEKFIPAERIAALCFNYNENAVKNKAKMWVNSGYDCAMWYNFETNILKPKKHLCMVGMLRNYDIRTYHKTEGSESDSNVGMPACNQVEIVKLLIKWGFVSAK